MLKVTTQKCVDCYSTNLQINYPFFYCSNCGRWMKPKNEEQQKLMESYAPLSRQEAISFSLDKINIKYKDENGFLSWNNILDNLATEWNKIEQKIGEK